MARLKSRYEIAFMVELCANVLMLLLFELNVLSDGNQHSMVVI